MKGWKQVSLRQTSNTYTFPMYRLGQTSSTGVSPSLQESRMSCSSLMAAWSGCQLLLDIFSPAESSSNQPQQSCCCLRPVPPQYHRVNSWLRDTSRWLFECSSAPKLAASVQWALPDCICMLFNIVVLLILVCSCTRSPHWGQARNWYVCYLLCTYKMVERGSVLNRITNEEI